MSVIGKKVKSINTGVEGIITGFEKGKILVCFVSDSSIPLPMEVLEIPEEIKEEVTNEVIDSKYAKSSTNTKTIIGTENIAIKCIYCNGGANDSQIGYDGFCSEDIIKYNIGKKTPECSDPINTCNRYMRGEITKEEFINDDFHCYECRMFKDWKAYAGQHKTEGRHGEKMAFKRVAPRSICVLTTILPYDSEDNRIIFGLFYINETENGDLYKEGYVKADPNYRIKFSLSEAKKLKFWDFYQNPNHPETKKWGTGLHRYLSNEQVLSILKESEKVKENIEERKTITDLIELFCEIKKI